MSSKNVGGRQPLWQTKAVFSNKLVWLPYCTICAYRYLRSDRGGSFLKPQMAARIAGLLAIICLLSPPPTTGQATAYGLAIPSSHPRLWWNGERLARARAWYQSNGFTPRSSPAEDRALDNAFVYSMTGNAANCRTALDAAASIIVGDAAANSPTNGVASDGMRWYGEHVILTYDWCYAHMTAADKDTLLNRWNFYLNNIRQHAWGGAKMYESNYMWGLRNMLEWGITLYGDSSMADTFLSDALSIAGRTTSCPTQTRPRAGWEASGKKEQLRRIQPGIHGRSIHVRDAPRQEYLERNELPPRERLLLDLCHYARADVSQVVGGKLLRNLPIFRRRALP